MQINRLFEIVYILLNKKLVTARELSKHLEVSYGNNAEVLKTQHIRDNVKIKQEEGLKKYL